MAQARAIPTVALPGEVAMPLVGLALRGSGLPRQDVFLTTKLPPGSAGRERETLAASLRALGTDYVDLWLVHWPPGGRARLQTWRELLAISDQGLARAVGVSNYSISQLDELIEATGQAPAVNQVRWSPSSTTPRSRCSRATARSRARASVIR